MLAAISEIWYWKQPIQLLIAFFQEILDKNDDPPQVR